MASFASTIFQFLGLATYNATPQTVANGSSNALQSDVNGYLIVNVAKQGGAAPPSWSDSAGLLNSKVVKATAGSLYQAYGSFEGTAKRWLMIFDSATVPSTGATPLASIALTPASTTLGVNFSFTLDRPRATTAGIVWALSTTSGTFTLDGGAASVDAHVEYS